MLSPLSAVLLKFLQAPLRFSSYLQAVGPLAYHLLLIRRQLLAFVTGSDRVPINGLGALVPPFVIHKNGDARCFPMRSVSRSSLLELPSAMRAHPSINPPGLPHMCFPAWCSDRLPTAHTCFNALLLSAGFKDKASLERALAIAIENAEVCYRHHQPLIPAAMLGRMARLVLSDCCVASLRRPLRRLRCS